MSDVVSIPSRILQARPEDLAMTNMRRARVPVGFSACAGACLFVDPSSDCDTEARFVLRFHSVLSAASCAVFDPRETLPWGAAWLRMPQAPIPGGLIGALGGWLRRKKGN